MKYKISAYRKEELISKLKNKSDIEKQIWNWMKQDFINLQEFRFILENIEIVEIKTKEIYCRLKDNNTVN